MPPPVAVIPDTAVELRVDADTAAEVAVASVGEEGNDVLSINIGEGPSNVVRLVGTCWAVHRLVIELDRELTRLARRPSLMPAVGEPRLA